MFVVQAVPGGLRRAKSNHKLKLLGWFDKIFAMGHLPINSFNHVESH